MESPHTHYATWFPPADHSWRHGIRKLALDLLSCGVSMNHGPDTPHVQFLYIHHVFEDEERNLHALLESLGRHYTFISHSEGVRRVKQGNIDAPYLCFSSDDGFLNNLQAARIFKHFGITACFFLNPNTIGLKEPERISTFCRMRLNARPVSFMDWDQVQFIQQQGHEIGSHSLAHLNLALLSKQEVQEDLYLSKKQLEERCGPIYHFAYPYGRWTDFNQEGLETCMKIGYLSCASAQRGCHINQKPLDLTRNLILRDQIILGWPERHIRYFLNRNLRQSPHATNKLHPA